MSFAENYRLKQTDANWFIWGPDGCDARTAGRRDGLGGGPHIKRQTLEFSGEVGVDHRRRQLAGAEAWRVLRGHRAGVGRQLGASRQALAAASRTVPTSEASRWGTQLGACRQETDAHRLAAASSRRAAGGHRAGGRQLGGPAGAGGSIQHGA